MYRPGGRLDASSHAAENDAFDGRADVGGGRLVPKAIYEQEDGVRGVRAALCTVATGDAAEERDERGVYGPCGHNPRAAQRPQ